MSIKLSICIPTYNRADLLISALQSIEGNLHAQSSIEVVVSDNGSKDNTQEIVADYSDRILNLRYHRNSENIGPVKNVRNVIQMAAGEFVWLFSDDDIMAEGALDYLLNFISNHQDTDYIYYTREVVEVDLMPSTFGVQPRNLNEDMVFSDGDSLFCGCGGQMPYLMGFYSSTIIRRQSWLQSAGEVNAFSDDYAWDHLIVILKAIIHSKCAVLCKTGVLARLNFRQIKARSKVGFDDSILCFLEIMKFGYSRKMCLDVIRHIVRIDSKGLVIDKAIGIRKDTLLRFFVKNKLKRMIIYSFPWFILNLLPYVLLNSLWRAYNWLKVKK